MGFFSLDDSWFKTHDIFLRKGSLIVNYMIDQIECGEYSQLLKRLCRYMTIDPIAMQSNDYSGNQVNQPDLKDSLLISSTEGTRLEELDSQSEKISSINPKPCLYNGMFNQEMKLIDQCYVFVHNYKNYPVRDDLGVIYVRIDVIVPNKYDDIYDFDSELTIKRGDAICFLIDDLFNNREIKDKKYVKYMGNLRFKLSDNGVARLTKTSDSIVYSLMYTLNTPRGDIYNGNI